MQLEPGGVDCFPKEISYWEERLRRNWSLGGVGYLGYGAPYNKWLYAVRKRVVRRCISELPVNMSSANVLDIGSGTGFWLEVWRDLGARSITGTDITATAVDRLRVAYPEIEVFRMDVAGEQQRWPIQGKFDLVSAFDVLFHITDDQRFHRAVLNIARVEHRQGASTRWLFCFLRQFCTRSCRSR
jgi:2-polyprenyl-3-methyl-5-hydroxy-6-metoxy-1,4-benzoquinol methylase